MAAAFSFERNSNSERKNRYSYFLSIVIVSSFSTFLRATFLFGFLLLFFFIILVSPPLLASHPHNFPGGRELFCVTTFLPVAGGGGEKRKEAATFLLGLLTLVPRAHDFTFPTPKSRSLFLHPHPLRSSSDDCRHVFFLYLPPRRFVSIPSETIIRSLMISHTFLNDWGHVVNFWFYFKLCRFREKIKFDIRCGWLTKQKKKNWTRIVARVRAKRTVL